MLGKLSRWAPVTGVLAIVLFIVGAALTSGEPDAKKSDAKIVAWLTDNGNQTKMFIGAAFVALAGAAFLWFFGVLRAELRTREGGDGRLSATAFGAGVVVVALLYVGMMMSLVVPATASYTSKYKVDANTARLFENLAFWAAGFAMFAAAVLVGATAVVSLRTAAFPKWYAYASFVVALLALFFIPLFGAPGVIFALWIATTSVILLRRSLAGAEIPHAVTAPTS